jgi:Response regulators consisting of a CheY-like receiver domain and a winged-helix DNA-binding domain
MEKLGDRIRKKRLALQAEDKSMSQRQVSLRIGIEPSYLSKIEKGQPVTLSEEKLVALAEILGEDPDYLLALGGKISHDVQNIIKTRPMLFARLVREMKDMPDEAIEAEQDFKRLFATLNRLHGLASIGAFQFSSEAGASFWTSQVPSILRIDQDTEPRMDSFLGALTGEDRQTLLAILDSVEEDRAVYDCELRLAAGDERPGYIKLWGYNDTAPDGVPVRMGIIQDISETVAMRAELLDARDSLQMTVEEQHTELVTAIRKLQGEVELRRELEAKLRTVNLDITKQALEQNTFFRHNVFALRSIVNRLFLEHPLTGGDGDDGGVNLKRISAKINDLSDYFLDRDHLTPHNAAFDLHHDLEATANLFTRELRQKNVTLTCCMSPDLPRHVVSDKSRIEQIVISILELLTANTPWGQIQLLASRDKDTPALILSLNASSQEAPVTMASFMPGPTEGPNAYTMTPAHMVGPLVAMLGGTLSVTEQPGGGVAVAIKIPFTEAKAQDEQQSPAKREKPILIVEDDMFGRLYVEKTLERLGQPHVSTSTGKQALNELSATRFGLILLDIQLPDINGLEITRTLRGDPGHLNHETPILAITAHATTEDISRFLESGIDDVLVKPYSMESLKAMMNTLFAP